MKYVAKTLYGLENILAGELVSMGAKDVVAANRAVIFRGKKELLYKVNYCSRTALSFLLPLAEFSIKSGDDLYRKCGEIDWREFMDSGTSFSVVPVVNSNIFKHTGYPGLLVKDAIADFFRKNAGRRPSVNAADPSVLVNLHISNEKVTVSLDSTVIPLYKRGYRIHQGIAPLNEVLAAGILYLSGWDPSIALSDPMCGSGTILIEAGLIANRVPPGKFRASFGFQRWKDYDDNLFDRIRKESDKEIISSGSVISGCDISEEAVNQSHDNISNAGLSDLISVIQADFTGAETAIGKGFLVFNPPYGERLGKGESGDLYSRIGNVLKHKYSSSTAWILTSGKENLHSLGLKPDKKITLFNGAIECILSCFSLYEGTRKRRPD